VRYLLILTIVLSVALSALSADWPQFRGPAGTGVVAEKGLNMDWTANPPKILWSFDMGDNGYAGISIANGCAFFVDRKDKSDVVRCLDVKTSKEKWNYTYLEDIRDNYGFNRCTPTVNEQLVYIVSRSGAVICLDVQNGEKKWERNLVADFNGIKPTWDFSMSVLIDGGNAIVCPGDKGGVVALDKLTGKTVWQGGSKDIAGYATPVVGKINGEKQYIVFNGKAITSVSAKDGALLWSVNWGTSYDINAASPIIIGDNKVFITSGYGHGCAMIEVAKNIATTKWENKNLISRMSCPVYYNGYIYGIGESGNMTCIDPETGNAKWSQAGFGWGTVTVIGDVILAVNANNGDLVMVKADSEKYTELNKLPVLANSNNNWTHPSYSDGIFIMRSKKKLVALQLK